MASMEQDAVERAVDIVSRWQDGHVMRSRAQMVYDMRRSIVFPDSIAQGYEYDKGKCPCRGGGPAEKCRLRTRPGSAAFLTPRATLRLGTASVELIYQTIEHKLRRGLSPPRYLTHEVRPPTPTWEDIIPHTPTDERDYSDPSNPPSQPIEDFSYDEEDPVYLAKIIYWGTPSKMRRKRRRREREALAAREAQAIKGPQSTEDVSKTTDLVDKGPQKVKRKKLSSG